MIDDQCDQRDFWEFKFEAPQKAPPWKFPLQKPDPSSDESVNIRTWKLWKLVAFQTLKKQIHGDDSQIEIWSPFADIEISVNGDLVLKRFLDSHRRSSKEFQNKANIEE
jgi:hypothetical protein